MKTTFSFSVVFLIVCCTIQAQNSILINKFFKANIGTICEETPDDNPCAGLEVYLVLKFSDKDVSIIEKEISSCGSEYVTFKLDYKWELTKNSEIKIHSNSKEIESNYLKDLVLKIKNEKVIGFKKRGDKNEKIVFQKMVKV